MKKYILLLALCLPVLLSAQTKSLRVSPPLSMAEPESVGMSSERLARIDAICKEAVQDGDIPGAVALVARKGKIVYYKAFGQSDAQTGKASQLNDIFRIASQSKAITSTAVMILWEEGKFRLDDPISKFIPEFKNPQVLNNFYYSDTSYSTIPAKREITIRDLLSHNSGIGYGIIDGDERMRMIYEKAGITDLFTTENITIGESVKKLAKLPLHHNPGEKNTYSEGLDVLGYFIEIVSGMPFDEFLRTRLFEPLGMNDTWFYLPKKSAERLVRVQHKVDGKWQNYPETFYDPEYPIKGAKTFFSGGAGLSSTVKDYGTFLQMYLNGGELNGVRILSRTTVKTILSNHYPDLYEGKNSYYSIGFGVLTEKGAALGGKGSAGTFDWGGYFNTQYFADPEEQIVGLIFKQTQGPTGDQTGWQFRQLVFQAIDD